MNIPLPAAIALQYLTLILVIAVGLRTLVIRRGICFFAIYTISLSLQLGLFLFYLPNYAFVGEVKLSETSIIRLCLALCLFHVVAILLLLTVFNTRLHRLTSDPPLALKPELLIVLAFVTLIFAYMRLTSPGAELVLNSGFSSLGTTDYYRIRGELIEAAIASNTSRFERHFINFGRTFLMVSFLVSLTFGLRFKDPRGFLLAAIAFPLMLGDELLRFQKAPILIVMLAAVVPFLIFNKRSLQNWKRWARISIGAGTTVFILTLGVLLVAQGLTGGEAVVFFGERLFLVPEYVSAMHFEVYPDLLPFVRFTGMRTIAAILGSETAPVNGSISLDVAEALTGQVYNANAGALAAAWANAGWIGVIFICGACAGLGFLIDTHLIRKRRLVDIRPLLIFFWLLFLHYGNSSLENVVVANSIWLVPFVYPYAFSPNVTARAEVECDENLKNAC